MQQDKKFKPEPKPFKQNKICSIYRATDQQNKKYFAKFFLQKKLNELNIFESTEYNQTVLSDLSDQIYPEHFLEVKYTYSIPEGFIFVTEPYDTTLENYLKSKVVEQKQALGIFQQVTKAIYSLYMAGFWHRNIRPEHFVKVGTTWKMESLVFNEHYQDANGLDSEYLWSPAYQPPEAYGKVNFSEEQLDEMIVWHAGSLLLDLLLSHHKLKDQAILNRFQDEPFSFKAIGVKKKFSSEVQEILSKMLHHSPKRRMRVDEYFSNEFISPEVSRHNKKNGGRKGRIYMSGQSSLSKSLSINAERAQQILTVKGFTNEKKRQEQIMNMNLSRKNADKLESGNQLLGTIKRLTKDNMNNYNGNHYNTISEASFEQSALTNRMSELLLNPKVSKAVELYKCYFDKCEILMIATHKIDKVQYEKNEVEALLLNKYAVTFVSLMNLHALAESMNQNLNFFELDPELWSQFQSSNEFRGFKEIINYRRHENKNLLNPIKERLAMLTKQQRSMLKSEEIEDFVQANYKSTDFQTIKSAYRKILKRTYDIVTRQYNRQKTTELASTGMYITYCMAIDKLYIPQDIADNFQPYFQWMRIAPSEYVPIDQFQEYLDKGERKTLVSHSVSILKKYFYVDDKR